MAAKKIGCNFGLGTTVFIVFLILKLCKLIDWSWWWVFSPLLISVGVYIIFFIIWIIVYAKIRS